LVLGSFFVGCFLGGEFGLGFWGRLLEHLLFQLNVERDIWQKPSPKAIKIWLNPAFPQRSEIT